jgi:hypothetical protein
MPKYLRSIILLLITIESAASQQISIKITAPIELKGRKAILLTREKGFGAIVHSLKLTTEMVDLQMSADLVPDLYELNVAKMKGSLVFFLEPGTEIMLDTTDVSRSIVTHSKSNPEWILFQETIQLPSSKKTASYTLGETRARKNGNTDSLNYWSSQKILEHSELLKKTEVFIRTHPGSFVSLYLLKNNWYAFGNKQMLENLDATLTHHRTYAILKEKSRKNLAN